VVNAQHDDGGKDPLNGLLLETSQCEKGKGYRLDGYFSFSFGFTPWLGRWLYGASGQRRVGVGESATIENHTGENTGDSGQQTAVIERTGKVLRTRINH
jgi:hypothetical protein